MRTIFNRSVHPIVSLQQAFQCFSCVVLAALAWLASSAAQAQTTNYALGATNLLVGPAAGTNSVVLAVTPATATWTATTNATWLHLSAANQSGTGSTNVIFTYDTNSGATRSGTLTLAALTLTVTQAGLTYVEVQTVETLESLPSFSHNGVTVDGAGNVYAAEYGINSQAVYVGTIYKWSAATGNVSELASAQYYNPYGLAVDGQRNIYFANDNGSFPGESGVYKCSPHGSVTPLISSGVTNPVGIALDEAGNLYIADAGGTAIYKWVAATSSLTPFVSNGLSSTSGVCLDAAGNLYVSDAGNAAITEWSVVNSNITTLVNVGLVSPSGIAVDGAGNVYVADAGDSTIKMWTLANKVLTTLVSSGLNQPGAVAVDNSGNVYIADTSDCATKEFPHAFEDPTPRMEGLASGNDSLPEVLPASINLTGPFAPVSSDPWLTITGITNGVVSFAFTAAASNRAANIALLGQTIYVIQGGPVFSLGTGSLSEGTNAGSDSVFLTVLPPGSAWTNTANANWLHLSLANQTGSGSTNVVFTYDQDSGASRTGTLTIAGQTLTVFQQGAFTYSLGTSSLVVGPAQGSNSVVFAVTQATRAWTATNNAAWLHLSPAYQNGAGSENVVFSYDANSGPTRYGTLTIGNQVLTVTQAGSTYVAAGALTTLVSSGLSEPWGVAVDTMGNVYFSDTDHDQIDMWVMTNNSVVNVVPTTYGWSPSFVAVNSSGIPYSCNYDPGLSCDMIVEWNGPSELVNFLRPTYVGLALDGMDNVYFPNIAESAIMEYTASNGNVSLVVSNLALPIAVALDAAGNIYVAEDLPGRVAEWNPQKSSLATLPISGVSYPLAVAVDGSGAVYIDDAATYAISKWTPANGTTSVLLSAGLNSPQDVAVDGAGNLYVADTENNAIKELPYAFVDPTPRLEGLAAASDALPPVLPTTENLLPPFAPTSDQSWLAITGITNGVVSFSFSANTGPARTANITLLGQTIPITQGVVGTPPMLTGVQVLTSGALQFAFTNNPSGSFTVLSTTDLSLPLSSWTVAGTATNNGSGMFQFTSQPTTNDTQLFYAVRSP